MKLIKPVPAYYYISQAINVTSVSQPDWKALGLPYRYMTLRRRGVITAFIRPAITVSTFCSN